MDEITLLTLIAKGENENADFKRELNLNSADEKAEFIKDVIALANSASDAGYLILGVDDSKCYIGVHNLEEEKLQQVAYTYIEPAVQLRTEVVPISTPSPLLIGVIEVQKSSRPHKVARAIGRLSKDDVFVRRGSTISQATPEEIIHMHRVDKEQIEARVFVALAETHLKARNYADAIAAYTKAIKDVPTYDLFLRRANAHVSAFEQEQKAVGNRDVYLPENEQIAYWKKIGALSKNALDDFMSAIRLSNSFETEKRARLMRFKFGCTASPSAYAWDEEESEFQWLQENVTGRELGEITCIYVDTWDLGFEFDGSRSQVGEEVVELMDETIQLGYSEPRAFYLRARGQLLAGNFGLAIHDLDKALKIINPTDEDQIVEIMCYKAEAFCALGRFADAEKTLRNAQEINEETVRRYLVLAFDLENRILYECALDYEFCEKKMRDPMISIIKYLALWEGRSFYNRIDETTRYTGLDSLNKNCPGVLRTLREIIGKELWEQMENKPDLQLVVNLPKLP
jgi:tetratricopeptide (TPR) repeat protein